MSVVKSLGEWQEGKRQQAEKASSRPEPQLALDEKVIDDADCETALEERQRHREALSEYRKTFKEADEKASGEIAKLELPEGGAVRVGRFRITRQAVAARSVAFDVVPCVLRNGRAAGDPASLSAGEAQLLVDAHGDVVALVRVRGWFGVSWRWSWRADWPTTGDAA